MVKPIALLACALLGLNALAWASDPARASRERELLRRAQQQLQQTQAQLGALQAENGKLAQALAEAERARDAARGRLGRVERDLRLEKQQREAVQKEIETVRQEAAQLRSQLAQERERLAALQATLGDTQGKLRATAAEKDTLERTRTRLERELAASEERNRELYKLGRELMVRFENKTCGEILWEKEPFTGLRRVQTENLLEYYRDRLDEQLLIKPPGG